MRDGAAQMRIEKSWGYEQVIHNGDYCCKKLVYTKPIASSLHYHNDKHETFTVMNGIFSVTIDEDDSKVMTQGDTVVIPPRTRHRVRCISPGTIIESSTHDYPQDCVRLVPSET